MSDSSSSKDSPPNESSNDSTDFDSSTPSKDTESPPPESESESPPPPPKLSSPSDNSESPPSRPPPPPPQSSSPPPPSKSPPPSSSNVSPPPPDLSSSPPPPQDGESFSPPPPKSSSPPPKSSSPPPEEEKAPPPPPSTSNLVFAPPPKGQSPSTTNATGLSKISPPPPPAVTVPPPPPPNKSSSVIVPLVPASTPPPPSPTIQNLSPPKTGNRSTPVTPTPKTNAASTPVKPSPSTQSEASTSTPRSTTSSSSSKPPPPKVKSDKFHVDQSIGAIIGVTLLVVLLSLLAIFFVMVMRKKKKMDKMYYRPPPNSVSVRSDGYYYRNANSVVSSSHSSSYASQQMSSTASGIMYDSNGGYGHFQGPPDPTGSRSCFTYEELMDITHGFAQENVIGEGGFGCVYKGVLPDGRRVAVKQLKAGSGQGEREFRAEVEIISRVHHRHLVSLVGYCIADYHRLLVYEFVPNGTLEHHLHGKGLPVMEWSKRLKIAIGSARGLAYLHEDCHPRIIHRDIKSANILLDNCFEAQVADFGLAKLSNDTNTHVSTRVMGTFGYMAPEYASSGKLTDRSDVFSFGVVLLELITGRKPVDASQPLGDESLVEWARPLLVHAIESGNFTELVDPRLDDNYARPDMSRMIEAAAACVRHSAPKRPRMVQVVRALDTDRDMADLTNGVKVGQSQVFNSSQYSADIRKFRQMAFASGEYESSEYGSSGELNRRSAAYSGELRPNPLRPVAEGASGYSSSQDSGTSAIYRRDRNSGGGNYRHSGRGFP